MVKVAVIGAGTMGHVHTDAYLNMSNVELVGIVDPRETAGRKLSLQRNTNWYSGWEELLENENPDMIDICVPTYLHRQYVEQAAKAKKHIICEKPLAGSLPDAQAMLEVCQNEGVRLFVAHVVRFFPEYRRAYDLVQNEAVGQIGTVRTLRGGGFPSGWEDWYANIAKSGSLIVDLMIHDFDFLRWCFGEVERVYAKSLVGREFNRLDHAIVSLRFKNGVMVHSEGSWAYPHGFRTELEIAGAEGVIEHNSDETASIQVSKRETAHQVGGVSIPESPLPKGAYQIELEHFIECIVHNREPIVTAEDGYKALEISLAALKSAQTGQPVEL